ncbi:MAG: HAD hydrolase-like protein [Actinomycetota bacterium]|nr:HAD hydrolase-like protein [Actinomycetota bacterium]
MGETFRRTGHRHRAGEAGRYQVFLTHYAQVLASRPPTACPGVVETIPYLRRNHHLFVHSASHSLLVRTDLQSLGILQCFDFVCGSDWQPVPKPHPRSLAMMAALLDAHGASLEGGWYVGDSPSDYDIATAVGLRFIAVAYDDRVRAQFLDGGVRPLARNQIAGRPDLRRWLMSWARAADSAKE